MPGGPPPLKGKIYLTLGDGGPLFVARRCLPYVIKNLKAKHPAKGFFGAIIEYICGLVLGNIIKPSELKGKRLLHT